MNPRKTPIDVLFVIAPHSLLLDIGGPAEAFRLANLRLTDRKQPPHFRMRFAGPVANLSTSVGLPLVGLEPLPKALTAPTWVVLVGQPSAHVRQLTPAVHGITQWLRRVLREQLETPDTRSRLMTVCSGTLLAARAGLVDGRRCTTHHDMLAILRSLAPRAQVMENRVFVIDGPVASSAGVTAGIDLALHLIAAECGEPLAAGVAEDLVVYLRRSLRDPELSPFLVESPAPALGGAPGAGSHQCRTGTRHGTCRAWRAWATSRNGICCGCSSVTPACRPCSSCGPCGWSVRAS